MRNRWLWWKKVFKWIITKSFTILTFGYYIKSIIEMNQYFLVSSVYEIYNFNTSQTWRIISLIFALLLFLFLIIFVIWIAYLAFTTFLIIKSKHNKFGQLFEGLKVQNKYKFYSASVLIRLIIFVVFLLTLVKVSSKILIAVLVFLQIVFLVYSGILRPYDEVKTNIILVMNEIYFLFLLGALIFLNSENDWSSVSTYIYMWVLASNSMIIFLIIFGKKLY